MNMSKHMVKGHLLAFFTCFLWGTTFIGTKVLLEDFTPLEILVIRFVISYLALWVLAPKRLKGISLKEEMYCAAAGLFGVAIYYLLENIALTYTYAANVSIIVSTAPLFTGIFVMLFAGGKKLKLPFYLGFVSAIAGIALISLGGQELHLSPKGDLLSVIAAVMWGIYSVAMEKISETKHSMILITRRIFFYGLLFMLPIVPFMGFSVTAAEVFELQNLMVFLFLGVLCGAGGFVFWNVAMRILGAVSTSLYIYLIPVITIIAGWLILGEPVNSGGIWGTILILSGLLLSQWKV